jgi:putative tryptophan/tyrosine transport system substrate-binding protein
VKRREFIALLGGATAWPIAARAQQPLAMKRIGVLMGLAESDPEAQARLAAFREGLRDLKWTEGTNVQIDVRWGNGDAARVRSFASELVDLAPDVILGVNTPPVRALKQATRTLPIVFTGLSDPVGDGIVTSLSKPGGNFTGFSSFDPALAGKWLQLLKEILPTIVRAAVIYNPDTAPHSIFLPALEAAAPSLAIALVRATVREAAEIENSVAAMAREPGGSVAVMPDIFTATNRATIISAIARHRLPAIYPIRYHVLDGGLISYGPDFIDLHRQAASHVDRILKGARPADLPVQTPTKFELVVNLRTAKALGFSMPPTLLARADEVLE